MKARLILIMALALMLPGCLDSEGDYQRLVEEKDALARELALAKKENEILTSVLAEATQERESLLEALNPSASPSSSPLVALDDGSGALPPGQAAAPPVSSGKFHIVGASDYLSKIAQQYGTTTEVLLQLNPDIRKRSGHHVFKDEKIMLP